MIGFIAFETAQIAYGNGNQVDPACINSKLIQGLDLSPKVARTTVGQAVLRGSERVDAEDIRLTNGRFDLFKQPFYDPNSLYIGVGNHLEEGVHHYYLVAGNKRYDGLRLFRKSKVRTLGNRSSLPKGVLFKINVPEDVMEKVLQSIEQNESLRTVSCLHGLCRVLNDAEIEIPFADGRRVSLQPAIAGVMDGNIQLQGKPLSPDQVRLIATSKQELEHFLRSSETAESNNIGYVLQIGTKISTGLGMIGAMGYVGYRIIFHKKDASEKR